MALFNLPLLGDLMDLPTPIQQARIRRGKEKKKKEPFAFFPLTEKISLSKKSVDQNSRLLSVQRFRVEIPGRFKEWLGTDARNQQAQF